MLLLVFLFVRISAEQNIFGHTYLRRYSGKRTMYETSVVEFVEMEYYTLYFMMKLSKLYILDSKVHEPDCVSYFIDVDLCWPHLHHLQIFQILSAQFVDDFLSLLSRVRPQTRHWINPFGWTISFSGLSCSFPLRSKIERMTLVDVYIRHPQCKQRRYFLASDLENCATRMTKVLSILVRIDVVRGLISLLSDCCPFGIGSSHSSVDFVGASLIVWCNQNMSLEVRVVGRVFVETNPFQSSLLSLLTREEEGEGGRRRECPSESMSTFLS